MCKCFNARTGTGSYLHSPDPNGVTNIRRAQQRDQCVMKGKTALPERRDILFIYLFSASSELLAPQPQRSRSVERSGVDHGRVKVAFFFFYFSSVFFSLYSFCASILVYLSPLFSQFLKKAHDPGYAIINAARADRFRARFNTPTACAKRMEKKGPKHC